MKTKLLHLALLSLVVFAMNSCSSDTAETSETTENKTPTVADYTYSADEIEAMKLINEYRVSIGLNSLEKINHISHKSEEHNYYMIANNVVSHDDFVSRSENIIKTLGAKTVGENIAYNFSSPKSAVEAWLKSPGHKANIEGNFTHFGIAIKVSPTTGKKYYTNIFAKI